MKHLLNLLWIAALAAQGIQAQDATEIVRKSVARDAYNFERLKNYTFLERTEERRYGRSGNLTSKEVETYEIMILAGFPYGRLVQKNDQPLSVKDARKEQEKLDKEIAKRKKESASEKAGEDKDRAESRRFLAEVPDAYILTLKGSETISGRPVWIIGAEPRPGYKPKAKHADLLAKMRGTLWVDQSDYQWVKADVEVISPVSVALGMLRIAPGGTFHFEQARVNEEVWLPSKIEFRADARVVFFKKLRAELDVTYRDYKKFAADSQIVGVEEVTPANGSQK